MAVFQVTLKWRWLLQECRNVFYYETITGNPSTSEWTDIVDEIRGEIDSTIKSNISSDCEFYGIDYRQVDVSGLPSFSAVPTSGALAGTSAVDSVPTQIALLVSVKENTTAPNHARTYLPGFNQDAVVDSIWGPGTVTNAEGFIDDMSVLNAAGTNELQRVAARWNTAHDAVTAYNNIAGAPAVASLIAATQRRRRIGVGI